MSRLNLCLAASLLTANLLGCHKATVCGSCNLPPTQRPSYLIEYTWGLISATSINSHSTGVLHNYKGAPADSLHFLWNLSPNVSISAVCSFIEDNGDSVIANILSLTAAGGVLHSDTSTIAFDTIITAAPWRPSYSDTLFISKVSPSMLVFQVGYVDSTGTGVEIDSFRNVGFFRPF